MITLQPIQPNSSVQYNNKSSSSSSFKGDINKPKSNTKKNLAVTLTCLGAVGTATFLILKKRKGINPKNVIAEPLQEVVSRIKYSEELVNPEMPLNSSIYSFLKRNVKGFYLENGREINTFLRTGELKKPPVISDDMPDYLKKILEEKIVEVKDFNRAIVDSVEMIRAKITSKTTKPMTVYRDAPKSWLETAENGILKEKAFCATSTEAGASMEGMIGPNASNNVRYEIRLPEGVSFWDLTHTSEKEMVLPEGSRFEIISGNILELIL